MLLRFRYKYWYDLLSCSLYRVLHHKPVESITSLLLDRMKYISFEASILISTKVHLCFCPKIALKLSFCPIWRSWKNYHYLVFLTKNHQILHGFGLICVNKCIHPLVLLLDISVLSKKRNFERPNGKNLEKTDFPFPSKSPILALRNSTKIFTILFCKCIYSNNLNHC